MRALVFAIWSPRSVHPDLALSHSHQEACRHPLPSHPPKEDKQRQQQQQLCSEKEKLFAKISWTTECWAFKGTVPTVKPKTFSPVPVFIQRLFDVCCAVETSVFSIIW